MRIVYFLILIFLIVFIVVVVGIIGIKQRRMQLARTGWRRPKTTTTLTLLPPYWFGPLLAPGRFEVVIAL